MENVNLSSHIPEAQASGDAAAATPQKGRMIMASHP
jgi:hypothetical protein